MKAKDSTRVPGKYNHDRAGERRLERLVTANRPEYKRPSHYYAGLHPGLAGGKATSPQLAHHPGEPYAPFSSNGFGNGLPLGMQIICRHVEEDICGYCVVREVCLRLPQWLGL